MILYELIFVVFAAVQALPAGSIPKSSWKKKHQPLLTHSQGQRFKTYHPDRTLNRDGSILHKKIQGVNRGDIFVNKPPKLRPV